MDIGAVGELAVQELSRVHHLGQRQEGEAAFQARGAERLAVRQTVQPPHGRRKRETDAALGFRDLLVGRWRIELRLVSWLRIVLFDPARHEREILLHCRSPLDDPASF